MLEPGGPTRSIAVYGPTRSADARVRGPLSSGGYQEISRPLRGSRVHDYGQITPRYVMNTMGGKSGSLFSPTPRRFAIRTPDSSVS
jgi:hypothetical protein